MPDVSSVPAPVSLETARKTPRLLEDMAVTRDRVAEQLKGLRELHGPPGKPLSQAKAARQAGVDERQWRRWEGKETLAGHDSLGRIAEGFDIPVEVFDNGKPDQSGATLADRLNAIDAALAELSRQLADLAETSDAQQAATASKLSDVENAVRSLESAPVRKPKRKSQGAGG